MRDARVLIRPRLTGGLFAVVVSVTAAAGSAFGDDDQIRFEQRLQRARAELDARNQARTVAGWTPKSWEEQQVTRLGRLQDARVRKQELAMTRSTFEAARAEVYMRLARDYMRVGHFRRAYGYVYDRDRVTGAIRPRYRSVDYWVMDPWAARLSAHFGNRAARSKGIAAAQEYHANTYYERLIRNSGSRIAALQNQIKFDAQMAGQIP
jgi:hypothetical protein